MKKSIFHLKEQEESLMFPPELFTTGKLKDNLCLREQKEVIEDTSRKIYLKKQTRSLYLKKEKISATVEYQHRHRKKIWKDKFLSLKQPIQIILLSQILEAVSTLKEKVLTPFWNQQSKEISNKLWLPTKTDYAVSVLTSSKTSYQNIPMGTSWFSITEKHPLQKNSLMTSFQSSQFSHPDSMVSEVTNSKNKSEVKLKTLKIRLFPTQEEKEKLHLMMEQSRWYYNGLIACLLTKFKSKEYIIKKGKFSDREIRDILKEYSYIEDEDEDFIIKYFKRNLNERNDINDKLKEKLKEKEMTKEEYIDLKKTLKEGKDVKQDDFIPKWWSGKDMKPHNRLARGQSKKISQNLNSIISNYKNGNINDFEIKFKSKKDSIDNISFEDEGFPKEILKMKSNYWYTDFENKKRKTSFGSIFSQTKKRGLEIIYDKLVDQYFIHYPVEYDFFPNYDRRNESQIKCIMKDERVISLDPGVRKFLVGYDPSGKSVYIGQGASLQLSSLLLKADEYHRNNQCQSKQLWREIRNLVIELHWKTISYLLSTYDTILLPDFRVSQMVKTRKLTRMTKRLMNMFSFHSFKTKLLSKARFTGKKIIIVDESYTSKTCTVCGDLNNVGGKETYKCKTCDTVIDRDSNGSRNIFIKNTFLNI